MRTSRSREDLDKECLEVQKEKTFCIVTTWDLADSTTVFLLFSKLGTSTSTIMVISLHGSIRMSQSVDKIGLRTLVVVTKADKSPEGLLEKVTADDVNIGLGYVCVRNRIGDESYEEARIEEERLFESHLMLSKIDKSIVGVPVLAQRLVQVQGMIISKTLPEIVKKINEKLTYNLSELDKLPVNLTCVADAMTAFLNLVCFFHFSYMFSSNPHMLLLIISFIYTAQCSTRY
ncbi:hypothetical protein HN51_007493 [Arachis hypogaea]|nr:dynamin-related protein 4C isoform X2 [Arachis hypogaea]